jgi:hypothetical protein
MVAPRHYGTTTGFFHCRGDRLGIGCDHDLADTGSFSTPQDVNDHWRAVQFGQRFAGQTRGREARRDEDNCVWHRGCRKSRPHVGECR